MRKSNRQCFLDNQASINNFKNGFCTREEMVEEIFEFALILSQPKGKTCNIDRALKWTQEKLGDRTIAVTDRMRKIAEQLNASQRAIRPTASELKMRALRRMELRKNGLPENYDH